MDKTDVKKQLGFYNAKKNKPEWVDLPALHYLMIDGKGNPNTSKDFQDAIEALYSVSYTLKFMIKKGPAGIDYGVMPLEALWWADDMNDFMTANKDNWFWTAMILQPDFITEAMVAEATKLAGARKEIHALDKLRFGAFKEGKCAQVLYTGPYADEGPTIQSLHEFIRADGHELKGKHHEIYLNDMRRTAPDKLKTIIRQPVA